MLRLVKAIISAINYVIGSKLCEHIFGHAMHNL